MKINKAYIVVGMLIAFAFFFELVAHGDELDQATKITFSEPIQVPGQVLEEEPGPAEELGQERAAELP